MEIKTGYFAQARKYESRDYVVVSIARWTPKWFNGLICAELSPSVDLPSRYKNNQVSVEDYVLEFNHYLSTINLLEILN